MNTIAIQKTIDTASKDGGGVVLIPEGRFLTGPFTLASRINLHLVKGAMILISDDMAKYPVVKSRYQDCISVADAQDIEISGEGTIDGQGKVWWAAFEADHSMTHRPYMIKLSNCKRVRVQGITLSNSPMFHLVPQNCTDVTIQGIMIKSPSNAHNTDGIDPSGWNYLIADCTIDAGDDNIAVKPGSDRTPGDKNYTITNCKFLHGHGMSIGSGTSGGIEDLTVSNCTFDGTDAGIRIKTARGRGGLLQNLTYENLTMTAVKNPIYIIDWYPVAGRAQRSGNRKGRAHHRPHPHQQEYRHPQCDRDQLPNRRYDPGFARSARFRCDPVECDHLGKDRVKIYHAHGIRFADSKIEVESGKRLTLVDAEVAGLE